MSFVMRPSHGCENCGHETECSEGFDPDPEVEALLEDDNMDCWRPDGCLLVIREEEV